MGKKFARSTKFFFFLCIASVIAIIIIIYLYGYSYIYYDLWFLLSLFIASYSGGLATILAVRDKAKINYSKGTKVFFIIFILSISTDIFSLVGEFWGSYYYYYVFFAYPVSIYATFISGIIVLILGLRDRSRPPMKGPVPGYEYQYPQYQSRAPISNAELTKILQISSRITIHDVASALKTDRANLLQHIAENQQNLPKIRIEGEYIINAERDEWVCPICGFVNLGPKTSCSDCKMPYSQ